MRFCAWMSTFLCTLSISYSCMITSQSFCFIFSLSIDHFILNNNHQWGTYLLSKLDSPLLWQNRTYHFYSIRSHSRLKHSYGLALHTGCIQWNSILGWKSLQSVLPLKEQSMLEMNFNKSAFYFEINENETSRFEEIFQVFRRSKNDSNKKKSLIEILSQIVDQTTQWRNRLVVKEGKSNIKKRWEHNFYLRNRTTFSITICLQ